MFIIKIRANKLDWADTKNQELNPKEGCKKSIKFNAVNKTAIERTNGITEGLTKWNGWLFL